MFAVPYPFNRQKMIRPLVKSASLAVLGPTSVLLGRARSLVGAPRSTRLPSEPFQQATAASHVLRARSSSSSSDSKGSTNSSSSRRSRITPVNRVKDKRKTVPDRLDYLPTSLAAATQELALLATPGSSWPAEALQAVEAAEAALHGLFFVVCCGNWAEGHPQAGRPAYALLQAVLVSMFAAEAEPSTYALRGKNTVVMYAVKEPEDLALPMAYFVMHKLDSNGWPTGAAYQSATAFEKQTDKKQQKKALYSCHIMYQGQPHTRLANYYEKELRTRQVEVPSRQLAAPIAKWARDQLTAAGVGVVPQEVTPHSSREESQSDPAGDDRG